MKKFCISLPIERPERTAAAKRHFAEIGLDGVQFIHGFASEVSGLITGHPYEVDNPGSGFNMGPKPVSIFLGHYVTWQVCSFLDEDLFMIMEDDVQFLKGWAKRLRRALHNVPNDFDVLFLGSCDAGNKERRWIAEEIFEIKYPQCLHCYLVRKKALGYMLATQRKVYGPMDCTLIFHTWPALKVYTLFPRLAAQFNTEISE